MNDAATITSSVGTQGVACAHCGDMVPSGLIDHAAEAQFCCSGCRTVYEVIHSCSLDRFYALKSETDAERRPVALSNRRFSEFDDPTFQRLYVREVTGETGLARVELFLPAAHCAACVWLVEKLPRVCAGVIESRLELRRALLHITWDRRVVSLSGIARALQSLGYPPAPARAAAMRDARRQADRSQIIRLGVAGACAGNVMLLALAMYAGMFDAIEPAYLGLFRWVSMAISLVSLAWPGSVFFRGAWSALRTRTLHLDVPIALGLGAGAAWGVVSTIRGTGEIYFDSLSVLVFALLLGRFIQTRQQRWTSDAVELLFSLTPTSARIVAEDGQSTRNVPIEAVRCGVIVEVRAGDSIPVDGVVVRGSSKIDQSLLTGESRAVDVREGMGVAAGAVNLASMLRVRVEATGEDTRVGRLMRIVEESALRRAPIVKAADRLAGWFVAAMLALALLTAGLWMVIDPARAVDNAAALLIVTCPCALGLATPLALTASIGRAARRGMLVKGDDALERLAKPGIIFLDKTGTLTRGRLTVVNWIGDETIKHLVAAIESHSTHPIAQALVRDLGETSGQVASAIVQTTGGGIEGVVRSARIVVGSPEFVRRRCGACPDDSLDAERELAIAGLSPVFVAIDGKIVAAAGLGDPIRDDAATSIAALRQSGWQVEILSGDHPEIALRVGAALGLPSEDCRGGVTPEGKLAIVRDALAQESASYGAHRPVVMVGDGVNDAAALAAASVGIAVHGGAEASLAAADVYLGQPGLAPIVELISAARRVMLVIRRNLIVSLMYNAIAATLAVTGAINPLLAAILMPLSSLTVVTLSFRSRTFSMQEVRSCR